MDNKDLLISPEKVLEPGDQHLLSEEDESGSN